MPRPSKLGLGKNESSVVRLRVPNELKADWDRYCCAMGETTAQESLRAVMRFLTSQPGDVQAALGGLVNRLMEAEAKAKASKHQATLAPIKPMATTEVVDRGPKKRLQLLLTPTENDAVKRIASERECSRQFWITSLVRAALTNGITVGGAELKALGEFNYQLMAIGRNLNQIAHQINADPDKHLHRLRIDELQKLAQQIKEGREYTHALVNACSHRWEITDARD